VGEAEEVERLRLPLAGDLDGDERLEYTAGTSGARYALSLLVPGQRFSFEHHLSAWQAGSGTFTSAFPRVVEDAQFFVNPAIADLDGDGTPEVIAGTGGYLVHALDRRGREPRGWPKFTGGWLIASPAVGDLDGDGFLEVVVNSREGDLYVWQTKGPTQVGGRPSVQWQKFHHDQWNSGNFHTPLPVRSGRLRSTNSAPR